MRTLYTPVLILSVLVVVRVLLTIRTRLSVQLPPAAAPFIRAARRGAAGRGCAAVADAVRGDACASRKAEW